jgi:hypothetical protein
MLVHTKTTLTSYVNGRRSDVRRVRRASGRLAYNGHDKAIASTSMPFELHARLFGVDPYGFVIGSWL